MKTFIGNQCFVDMQAYEKSHQYHVEEQIALAEAEGRDDPFMIGDLGDVIKKYKTWVRTLPRVKPFYAVKCNDDYPVLKVLSDIGASFDCASKGEIQKILSLGVSPDRIIYANPCKQASMLKYAAKQKVATMTFDNEAELYKVKSLYPDAKLVLRILPPSNFKVQCELGIKFGCHPSKAVHLLEVARDLDLDVIGVSFHVGSGCQEAGAFAVAIQQAREVFDIGVDMGFNMELLDIGGGFPGQKSAPISFLEIAQVVNMALDKYFPANEGVSIIAEPGRYFVASAFTLGVNIIAKRVVARDQHGENGELIDNPTASDEPAYMYYVNDGVYGSFNCLLFDHAEVSVNSLKDLDEEMMYESSVWGPTCDGLDCILQNVQLPLHDVGTWLYFKDMGAYTIAASSTFNGMPGPSRYYHCLAELWHEVYPENHKTSLPIKIVPKMKTGHSLKEARCGSFESRLSSSIPSEGLVIGDHEDRVEI